MLVKKFIINNNYEYKKFLKKINLYKSVIYYNTLFEVESRIEDRNLKYIINALNIKKRKKRIEYIYDKSCNLINNKNKGINICGFKEGKCYVQRCQKSTYVNGCCRNCRYQSNDGCLTSNFACKLFNCGEVKKRHNVIGYKDLKILKLLSIKNRFIIKSDYFSNRDDVLKDLYCYSLIYSTIRIVYRLLRDYFYIKKIQNSACKYFGGTYKSLMIELFKIFEKINVENISEKNKIVSYNKKIEKIISKKKEDTKKYLKTLTNNKNNIDNAMFDLFLGYDELNYNIVNNLYNIYQNSINLVECESEGKMKFIVSTNQKIFDRNYNINQNLKFNFSYLKIIYDFAQSNNKYIKHHDFLWHNSVPENLKKEIDSINKLTINEQTKKELKRKMALDFIDYYALKLSEFFKENNYNVIVIDALNEIANDDFSIKEIYRNSFWKEVIGKNPDTNDEYFIDVLKILRKYFPKIQLIYNDYNEFYKYKCNNICKIIKYVKKIEKRDAIKLIDGLGLQSHYRDYLPQYNRLLSKKDIIFTARRYKKLNIPLYCTEFDFILEKTTDNKKLIETYVNQYVTSFKGFVYWGNSDHLTWHHCVDREGNFLNGHIIDKFGNFKKEYLYVINIFGKKTKKSDIIYLINNSFSFERNEVL